MRVDESRSDTPADGTDSAPPTPSDEAPPATDPSEAAPLDDGSMSPRETLASRLQERIGMLADELREFDTRESVDGVSERVVEVGQRIEHLVRNTEELARRTDEHHGELAEIRSALSATTRALAAIDDRIRRLEDWASSRPGEDELFEAFTEIIKQALSSDLGAATKATPRSRPGPGRPSPRR